jgi:hypothetical protein
VVDKKKLKKLQFVIKIWPVRHFGHQRWFRALGAKYQKKKLP